MIENAEWMGLINKLKIGHSNEIMAKQIRLKIADNEISHFLFAYNVWENGNISRNGSIGTKYNKILPVYRASSKLKNYMNNYSRSSQLWA